MSRDDDEADVGNEEVSLDVDEQGARLEHELGLGIGPVLEQLGVGPEADPGHDLDLVGMEPELERTTDLLVCGDSLNFGTGGVGRTVIIWKIVSIEKLSAPQIPSKLLPLLHFSCLRATRY